MHWAYARMIQKLVVVNDALDDARKACQMASDGETYRYLYKIQNEVDKLIHVTMTKGTAEPLQE